MLRLHLPPNLVAAAGRDAVPIRVEIDQTVVPPPEVLPLLALLQRWNHSPIPPKLIQLSRAQLRELAGAAGGQAIFVENGRPTPWQHAKLVAETQPADGDPAKPPAPTPSGQLAARRPASAMGSALTVDGSEHFLAITLPSREHPRYADALALLQEHGFALEPSNRKWWLRDRHKTLNFLARHRLALERRLGAEFTPIFEKNTAHLRTADVVTEISPAGDDFVVSVGLRAGSADEAALRSAVAANRGYLEADGKVFLLEPERLAQLDVAQRALAGDPTAGFSPRRLHRLPRARAAEAQEVLEQLSPNFQAPEAWRARSAALRNLSSLPPAPISPDLDTRLRPYQRLGAAWLWHLHRQGLGGVLADEMGLGKTLQALALLSALPSRLESGTGQPLSLVVAPASLLENWRRETIRFVPGLRVFVHHGEQRLATAADFHSHDLIITSYGTLARDQTLFTEVEFSCVIADEAQHIKNRRSQNAAALRALRAQSRFLLTGTPLENSLEDLRSLFEFVLPGYLNRVPDGVKREERAWFDERLRAQTAPYLLRRTKQAVAPELPAKLEQVVWCDLTPAQARLYRETQENSERELFDLEAGGASETKLRFAALTQLLRLRQICCDPRLVNAEAVLDGGSAYQDSAKLETFRELVAEAVDDGHRVLVFSQFTSLLALLRAELDAQQLAYCYLDGSMPAQARQTAADQFQASPEIPLFLLSLKAGGTGLNLTGADTVVHFDPWWNPAAEAQATDRAHRIGQTRVVTSYKLIAAGTVEEKVLGLQAEKRALLAGVFEASDALSAKLTLTDMKALLGR
ncbi:MAG: DEAD/DEAH box helicase [Verrucomicrobia bacterium]|nr:MAG: DEAD/DEAH box helicase [Verrucomicrobiota bacterium]